ncbi:hypothetical protein [Methylobacterium sp. WL8]|uniref:hypothetical protein n=1 Tax=Methylobacterium sp. WL8 TaxID=2603899 RepID=UPI0011CB3B00|nr:hypothetical protein [Methylobacterium sp. WL8]TXN78994.1 hypothetical protein FV234_21905 [Methylobacterium sp. WL8]
MTAAATIAAISPYRMIWVTFQKGGFHCWPDASGERSYLSARHRHLFKFRVWIQVWHRDREIEFHTFLDWVESLYFNNTLELDGQSCETISDRLHETIAHRYPDRDVWIDVSEDGECGSFTRYAALEPRS